MCPDFMRGKSCVRANGERAGQLGHSSLSLGVREACPPGSRICPPAHGCTDTSCALGLLKNVQTHSHGGFTLCQNPCRLNSK